MSEKADKIRDALCALFPINVIRWKPQMVKNNRAMAIAYLDARIVQDRLDDAVGVQNWQTEYQLLPEGSVQCRLSVRIDGEWIGKADVGSPSEQPDGGDRMKAAYSDALKRAAVAFGIGRYLYRLPHQWVDYDAAKRQLAKTPTLPDWAIPKEVQTDKEYHAHEEDSANFAASEDIHEIYRILEKCKVNMPAFLTFAQVAEVEEITTAQLPKVMDMLRRKEREFDAAKK